MKLTIWAFFNHMKSMSNKEHGTRWKFLLRLSITSLPTFISRKVYLSDQNQLKTPFPWSHSKRVIACPLSPLDDTDKVASKTDRRASPGRNHVFTDMPLPRHCRVRAKNSSFRVVTSVSGRKWLNEWMNEWLAEHNILQKVIFFRKKRSQG